VSVVVSDTSPLHYLILCGVDTVLARLFERVVIPPAVFAELQHSSTPLLVREWMRAMPGRTVAAQLLIPVIGTLGLLERAATHGWIDLPQSLERLRQTNARLDPTLIEAALQRYEVKSNRKSEDPT